MPRITTKLSKGTAEAFLRPGTGGGADEAQANELRTILEQAQVVLRPLRRAAPDPELGSYFVADVPKGFPAERLVELTKELAGVSESVYLKPDEEMP